MNPKNFDGWNELKKNIDMKQTWPRGFNEGDIWWASIGINIGDEEDGKNVDFERPVLIVRRFNNRLAIVIPLGTTAKDGEFFSKVNGGTAMLSQIRLVSSKRLTRFFKRISKEEFEVVRRDLISAIFTYF